MRKLITLFVFSAFASTPIFTQTNSNEQIPTANRKIQMAILFDASGSMNGLLNQAKARMWSIVNELTELRHDRVAPTVEIALYSYGNDGHPSAEYFVKQLVPLTSDLDLISEKLFSITTNGGSEYCAGVISKSLDSLAWSNEELDLKMIYIAGNEPFDQGPLNYKTICKQACDREIYVNTIHCGSYDIGVRDHWYDGAQIGCGDYFHIDAAKSLQQIATPYDSLINVYNDSLNQTYMGYGKKGIERKELQNQQDLNAISLGSGNKAERSVAKTKLNYNNASWDIIDAQKEGKIELEKLTEEELPEELKGKTTTEKNQLIDQKMKERESLQKRISELAVKRSNFIEEEKKKTVEDSGDDFGSSVSKSIEKKSSKIGYTKQNN